jgi:thiamine kinase-like enzyme
MGNRTTKIPRETFDTPLCHSDIHAANLLISNGDFFIVDWDTLIMAPKERELMFIGAGIADKQNTDEKNQKSIIEIVESIFLPGNVVEMTFKTDHPLFH